MTQTPRVAALTDAELSEEQRELLAKSTDPKRVLNIFRTLVRHPDLYRAFMRFGGHILRSNSVDARLREILILRVGHLCDCAYEFHQHTAIGLRVGLTQAEIDRIRVGASAPEWTAQERALIQATDELHAKQRIGDATWNELTSTLSEKQLMDVVFTVGQYTMVCMALSTFGVQIER